MTYPNTPGYRNADTSKAAAESVAASAPSLRGQILASLEKRPATLWELSNDLGMLMQTVSGRVTELHLKGKIQRVGKRQTPTGRMAALWDIVREPAADGQ